MRIKESELRKLIANCIMEAVSEGTNMQSLYHFTYPGYLENILCSKVLRLSDFQRSTRNGKRYASFTRHKSAKEGFSVPGQCTVRIEVDGRALSNVRGTKTYPFEYYSPNRMEIKGFEPNEFHRRDKSAKEKYADLVASGGEAYGDHEYLNQAEESFESEESAVPIKGLIKRIDIFVDEDASKEELDRVNMCRWYAGADLVGKMFVYNNYDDFSMQTNRCIPLEDWHSRTYNKSIAENKNIRLNESELREIISECVEAILRESENLPAYEMWKQYVDADATPRLSGGKKCVWRVNGKLIIDNKGHAVSHIGYDLMQRVLEMVDYSKADAKGYLQQEVVFPYPVGYSECVETTDDDDIVYMQRPYRSNLSRFVLNKEAVPCNTVQIAMKRLNKEGTKWLAFTAYVGKKGGLEPRDKKATDKDEEFWRTHALIAGKDVTKDDDRGDMDYWRKKKVVESIEPYLRQLVREAIVNEMDANLLDPKVNVEEGDGYVHVSFGKNGWGLTDEFLKIHEVVSKISRNNNIYLEKCQIDPLDDKYDFYFKYDNENFDK